MSSCNIFLSLTFMRYGRVDGEAQTEGFEGQIEIADFNWGLGRPNSNTDRAGVKKSEKEFEDAREANQEILDTGIDPKTGKEVNSEDRFKLRRAMLGNRILPSTNQVTLKDFCFTKRFDLSSTVMLNALNSQDEIKEATFSVLRFGKANEKSTSHFSPLYVVKLRRARVASLDLALQSEGNAGWALIDTVVFKFRSVDVEYFPVPKADTSRPAAKTPAKTIGRGAAPPAPPGPSAPTRQAGIPFSYNAPGL